jgi:hypothetical protein
MNFAAESQRKLQPLTWSGGQIITRELPRDCVLKRLLLRLSGTAVCTFSSGGTIIPTSSFDSLISRVDVVLNGSRTVKSIRPWLAQMEGLLTSGFIAERKSYGGAAAAYANNPTVDAGWTPGTTGQPTTIAESIAINFSMVMAEGDERFSTMLDLRGAASAELRISCATASVLDVSGNITFSAENFQVEVTTVESPVAGFKFSDWRQTTKEVQFSAQVTEQAIDINRGNYLTGLKLFVIQDPAAAESTKANCKKPNNNSVTDIKLILNGNRVVKSTTFHNLQAENRMRFGVNAPFGSNVSLLDGFAYLDLLDSRKLRTALDVRPPAVDNVQLLISSRQAAANTNVYPISITIETGEMVHFAQ